MNPVVKKLSHAAACFICLLMFFTSYANGNNASIFYQTPESGTATDKQKKVEAVLKTEPKKGFVKMLVDKIKFKKNAREKEKARIITLVENLGLKDSIAANAGNIQLIIHELEKKENQHFDSLKKIINTIRLAEQGLPADMPGDANEGVYGNSLSDKDLETLAGQIVPLLKEKDTEEKEEKEKQEVLKKLKEIRNNNVGIIHTQQISDSIIKRYKVALKNKTEVFGFYDGAANSFTSPSVLESLNSLIYYSLPINDTTGDIINKESLYTAPVVSAAQTAGCSVYFNVLLQNKNNKSSFLYNVGAWQNCIDNLLYLLKKTNANGIVVSFKNLPKKDRSLFTDFVRFAFNALQQSSSSYRLLLTLPRFELAGAYDIQALDEVVDKFFIDFATNTSSVCSPLAPLKGRQYNTIESSFAWYETQGIKANKLVLILPYRGTNWQTRNALLKKDIFTGYLNVSTIENKYGQAAFYDETTSSAYVDTVYPGNRTYRIWYDNEITLGEKYDYILENDLGGAALFCINYDEGLRELRDELTYKFAVADTTYLADSVIKIVPNLSFLQKAQRYLTLYRYILQNPCATCFESDVNTPQKEQVILSYMSELKIDSLVRAEKAGKNLANDNQNRNSFSTAFLKMKFNYINAQLTKTLLYITLFLLLISFGFICVYVAGLRYNGENWQYKKIIAFILILFCALFVLSAFTWCFTNDLIPLFGVSGGISLASGCNTDPTCINIPFSTLLLIIIAGVFIGFLLFRFFITPLLKKEDVP